MLAEFSERLDGLLAKGKGDADLIQLSGGEPTIHPDFFAVLDHALGRVRQVYVNTNGIRLADRAFAEKLAARGPTVSVYLQFDGFKRSTLELLRGRGELLETKFRAADHCEAFGTRTRRRLLLVGIGVLLALIFLGGGFYLIWDTFAAKRRQAKAEEAIRTALDQWSSAEPIDKLRLASSEDYFDEIRLRLSANDPRLIGYQITGIKRLVSYDITNVSAAPGPAGGFRFTVTAIIEAQGKPETIILRYDVYKDRTLSEGRWTITGQ